MAAYTSTVKPLVDPFANILPGYKKPPAPVSTTPTPASPTPSYTPAGYTPDQYQAILKQGQAAQAAGYSPSQAVIPQSTSTPTPAPSAQTQAIPQVLPPNQYGSYLPPAGTPSQGAQNAPGATSAPATPQVSPQAQKAVELAQSAYERSLQISPDELSTQEDLDKLIESSKTAYRNAKGQAIPLEFITGQLKSLEERAIGLAEPLEQKLSRMQAARLSSIESSKFALDRADKALESEYERAGTARTEAEAARRFGIEQAGSEVTRALQEKIYGQGKIDADRKFAQDKIEADRKFEEDKRQFGLDYAIKQRELAAKEKTASITGGATAEKKLAIQNEALTLAKELRGADAIGKSSAVGGSFAKFVPFGSSLGLQGNRNAYEAKVGSLKAMLTYDNLKLMTGVLTDRDIAFLTSIGTSLTTDMNESEFDLELDKVIGKLESATSDAGYVTAPDGTRVKIID